MPYLQIIARQEAIEKLEKIGVNRGAAELLANKAMLKSAEIVDGVVPQIIEHELNDITYEGQAEEIAKEFASTIHNLGKERPLVKEFNQELKAIYEAELAKGIEAGLNESEAEYLARVQRTRMKIYSAYSGLSPKYLAEQNKILIENRRIKQAETGIEASAGTKEGVLTSESYNQPPINGENNTYGPSIQEFFSPVYDIGKQEYIDELHRVYETKTKSTEADRKVLALIGGVPDILWSCGIENKKMYISRLAIRKAIGDLSPEELVKDTGLHNHNLTWNILEDLPELLADPVAVYKDRKEYIAVLNRTIEVNNKETLLVAAISASKYSNGHAIILSAYGRNNIGNKLREAIKVGNVLYFDRNKKTQLKGAHASHLPLAGLSIPDSIPSKEDIVKQYNLKDDSQTLFQATIHGLNPNKQIEALDLSQIGQNITNKKQLKAYIKTLIDNTPIETSDKHFMRFVNKVRRSGQKAQDVAAHLTYSSKSKQPKVRDKMVSNITDLIKHSFLVEDVQQTKNKPDHDRLFRFYVPVRVNDTDVYTVRIVSLHNKSNPIQYDSDIYDVIVEKKNRVPLQDKTSVHGQKAPDTISVHDLLQNVKDTQARPYYQPARGSIEFNRSGENDGSVLISLLEKADESTLPHELAHLFLLDMQKLAQLTPDGRLKGMLEDLEATIGNPDVNGNYTIDQQELFAKTYERYLYEGKTSAKSWQKLFVIFKNWLHSIYKSVKDLPALSSAAKNLFDTWLSYDDVENIPSAEQVKEYAGKLHELQEVLAGIKENKDISVNGIGIADVKKILNVTRIDRPADIQEPLIEVLKKTGVDYKKTNISQEVLEEAGIKDVEGYSLDKVLSENGYIKLVEIGTVEEKVAVQKEAESLVIKALNGEAVYRQGEAEGVEHNKNYADTLAIVDKLTKDQAEAENILDIIADIELKGARALDRRDIAMFDEAIAKLEDINNENVKQPLHLEVNELAPNKAVEEVLTQAPINGGNGIFGSSVQEFFSPVGITDEQIYANIQTVLKNKKLDNKTTIDLGYIPNIYVALSVKGKELKASKLTFRKALGLLKPYKLKKGIGHNHNITDEILKKTGSLIADPLIVMKSKTKANSLIAVLDATVNIENKGKQPVITVIYPAANGNSFTFIPSIYEREKLDSLLDWALENNKILYADKKRVLKGFAYGLAPQLLSVQTSLTQLSHSSNSIPSKEDIVKKYGLYDSGNTLYQGVESSKENKAEKYIDTEVLRRAKEPIEALELRHYFADKKESKDISIKEVMTVLDNRITKNENGIRVLKHNNGTSVVLSKAAISEMFRHTSSRDGLNIGGILGKEIIVNLPEVFRNSVLIARTPDLKNKTDNNFIYYGNVIKSAGKDFFVKLTVKEVVKHRKLLTKIEIEENSGRDLSAYDVKVTNKKTLAGNMSVEATAFRKGTNNTLSDLIDFVKLDIEKYLGNKLYQGDISKVHYADVTGKSVKPVIIPKDAVPAFKSAKELKAWIISQLNLVGNISIKDNGRQVQFSKSNIDRSLKGATRASQEVKKQSYFSLREIVENAVYGGWRETDAKHPNVKGQELYYNSFVYDGKGYGLELYVDIPVLDVTPFVYAGHNVIEIVEPPQRAMGMTSKEAAPVRLGGSSISIPEIIAFFKGSSAYDDNGLSGSVHQRGLS